MREIYEFLKKAGTYYLATCENGQPRVRPFGTVNIYKDRLYIQTGRSKAVSRQLHANPRLELCAMLDGRWLRLEASAVEDDDREARVSMLEAYPELKALYSPDDGNTEVWYLRNAAATVYSFTEAPELHKF
ncbi:MAG: pyridoxamine 5'-phosphate oxidase family protein [Firmicutes bacterium]|nr:NimC/NimA family protein [Oscillospiraceae bacterium]MBS5432283.1 pyridoxamine 5'-phosphate oxidase family protein [Bacillota bacterium]